jgi:peptidoglycan biosynthesis protein MviN/MurJ (putative lipid II flippase)
MLQAIAASLLTPVLIPIFAGERDEKLVSDAWTVLLVVTAISGLISIVLFISISAWMPLISPGFPSHDRELLARMVGIQLMGGILLAVNVVLTAVHHARLSFLRAEVAPLASGVIALIVLYWALPVYGVIAAAVITVVKAGVETFLLLSAIGLPRVLNFKSAALIEAWRRMRPLLLGVVYYKSDVAVDRYLLSMANSGSLSLYYLAQQIHSAASLVLTKALISPMVPVLSRFHKAKEMSGFRDVYRRRLKQIAILCLLVVLIWWFIGRPMLGGVVGHKNFDQRSVGELWSIVILLSGMFAGAVLGQLCSSVFYAVGDTRTPTAMSVITYTCYIPCKIFAFSLWGVPGLALTTSIYYLLNFAIQAVLIEGKWK